MAEKGLSPGAAERRVVVIDDDEVMRITCREILAKGGFTVETFANGQDGINRLREVRPQVLLLDLKMPGLDGFAVMEIVRKLDPDVIIVVITGYATIGTAVDAMKRGAYDFLPKPFTPDELRLIVARGYERWLLSQESLRLRREKQEVERRFITFVSHQLKSPLAAVKQYLDVLLFDSETRLPEKVGLWIGRCQVRVADMLQLIQDWLTVAKLERGALCQPRASSDLRPIVENVIRDHQHVAEAAGVTLELGDTAPLRPVCGDSLSLTMLVGNLVGNAIKYNRKGGKVTLRLEQLHDGETAVLLCTDTGIGIPEEFLPRLFTEFYRVRTDATEDVQGTGLGLVICQKIVEELGGRIGVESREGEGSTFRVELPVAAAAGDKPVV
jgi:two-component system, sensor histidine kinase and response regulator